MTRDAFDGHAPFSLQSYIARQTLASVGSPPIVYEPGWYDALNRFERTCVATALENKDEFWRFEQAVDVLIVDYVDERFDLMMIGASVLNSTKHLLQPQFLERHAPSLRAIPRRSEEATALWRAGCERFFARALGSLPPERIILHEARWAPSFRAADGSLTPLPPAYEKLSSQTTRFSMIIMRSRDNRRRASPSGSPRTTSCSPTLNIGGARSRFIMLQAYYASFLHGLIRICADAGLMDQKA